MSNLYSERDIIEQGDHYSRHTSAMTGEGLHSKSDIAAELAHRGIEIERLQARVAELEGTINAVGEAFGTGSAARTRGTLVTCAENTVKFTKCLDAVERFFMVPGEPDDDYPDCEVDDVCLLNHWANSPEEYAEQFRVEILRKQAEAVEAFVDWVKPHWPKSLAIQIADDGRSYVFDLRNEAAKAGGDL